MQIAIEKEAWQTNQREQFYQSGQSPTNSPAAVRTRAEKIKCT